MNELFNVSWSLIRIDMYIFAGFFISAGFAHFLIPTFFLRIVPKWVPYPKYANFISGAVEIIFGILLFPNMTRSYAAWGIFLLLLAVWPANYYHFKSRTKKDPPKWLLLLRLPLQIPLLYWAYSFT